jgi:magnesium-transporting ATPase (P-type)
MLTQTFEMLNVNKFNSTRKRMSVVTRLPDGQVLNLLTRMQAYTLTYADA